MKKEDFKKLEDKVTKFGRISAEHAFLSFLALVFIASLVGGLLFYQYSILIQRAEPQITEEPIQFKENLYQEILGQWQARNERFEEVDKKEHLDIFK